MGRMLMRVPLDFDAPLDEVWRGYTLENAPEEILFPVTSCDECDRIHNDCSESADYCVWYNQKWRDLWHEEPPVGEGYQLWENTTEGSPQSPVFKTLEELCEWCEKNATTFADFKASKEEWHKMFSKQHVYHTSGNITFI